MLLLTSVQWAIDAPLFTYISFGVMGYIEDLESIGKLDWFKFVLENIALGFAANLILTQ